MKISILLMRIDVFTMSSDTILPFINNTDFCVCVLIFCWRPVNGQQQYTISTHNSKKYYLIAVEFCALHSLDWTKTDELKMPSSIACAPEMRNADTDSGILFPHFAVKNVTFGIVCNWKFVASFTHWMEKSIFERAYIYLNVNRLSGGLEIRIRCENIFLTTHTTAYFSSTIWS